MIVTYQGKVLGKWPKGFIHFIGGHFQRKRKPEQNTGKM